MPPLIDSIFTLWMELTLWLVAFTLAFGLLSRITPCNPGQPFICRDFTTDLLYCFIMPILSRFVRIVVVAGATYLLFYGASPEDLHSYMLNGYGFLKQLPLWGQAAIIFLISDFILYWTHRWFHGKKLWNYHAIHHSPTEVDWTSTFRFHPVNTWLTFTMVDALMLIVGFSPLAVSLFASFNLIYSAMVHANLNWTFGPFKYVFASPVFHRWHHTAQEEGMDKNFAPTFPLLDIVFGTFYMPENRVPERYGVAGSDIPRSFLGQMLWPFRQNKR